jgi:predicted component of type VI protein secretion system
MPRREATSVPLFRRESRSYFSERAARGAAHRFAAKLRGISGLDQRKKRKKRVFNWTKKSGRNFVSGF